LDALSPRDRALALVPFYAGARIAETVARDIDDVRLSARKGILRIYGKAERVRELPYGAAKYHQTTWSTTIRWSQAAASNGARSFP